MAHGTKRGGKLPAADRGSRPTTVGAGIKVLIADPNTLLRQALAMVLTQDPAIEIVGQAGRMREALDLAEEYQPDVVLVDLGLSQEGMSPVPELTKVSPESAVVVLTDGDASEAEQAFKAGARGFLGKNCELADVIRAIARVGGGDVVMMVGAPDGFAGAASAAYTDVPHKSLTQRELEIVHLVVQGCTNSEIARRLFVTDHTVKGHLAKILGKLMLDNRVQLTAYAAQAGLAQLIREPVRVSTTD